MTRTARILACMALTAAAAAPALLAQREAALGAKGELYLVRAGTYGELFPRGRATERGNRVLALDVVRSGAAAERLLVPGTEGADVERLPALVFEDTSGTVFLVWESQVNYIHPILMLSGLGPERQWLEPIEIIGNAFANKTSPQLAVTYDVAVDDGTAAQRRTILHLLWGEENGGGLYETFYTPIVLENGRLSGRNPIYRLDELDPSPPAAPVSLSPELVRTSKIQRGRDERTVVVAFTSPATRRLVAIEIDWLPVELGRLADELRLQVIDIGSRVLYPANRTALAEQARRVVLERGKAFYAEIAGTLAKHVYDQVLIHSSGDLVALADGLRLQVIDIGSKLSGRGLQRQSSTAPGAAEILEVPAIDAAKQAPHLVQLRVASSRPAPTIGGAPLTLFVSASGEDALIAWSEPGRLLYRESRRDGWSEILELSLSETFDLARGLDVLQRRIRTP